MKAKTVLDVLRLGGLEQVRDRMNASKQRLDADIFDLLPKLVAGLLAFLTVGVNVLQYGR